MNHQLANIVATTICLAIVFGLASFWLAFMRRGRSLDRANKRLNEALAENFALKVDLGLIDTSPVGTANELAAAFRNLAQSFVAAAEKARALSEDAE